MNEFFLIILGIIIFILVMIPISAWLLMVITKFFKIVNSNYKKAFKISLLLTGLPIIMIFILGNYSISYIIQALVLVLFPFIAMGVIKSNYGVSNVKSFFISLIWVILMIIFFAGITAMAAVFLLSSI